MNSLVDTLAGDGRTGLPEGMKLPERSGPGADGPVSGWPPGIRQPLAKTGKWAQTDWVNITVTEVAPDGQLRRRRVDTASRDDASSWEGLAKRVIGEPPEYQPAPGRPVYAIQVDDQEIMVAEKDVTGPLGQLVTAVLTEGSAG